ncbi:precorrin-2 C(20)-methyltransferase [Acaryochloris sp. IP29b_bin.137]|uniref:precorrin-2 C(20)-methyltransferase n=1 Tax=Acaryochloris sp. IP29b_bin.137 TaxID=2969217 RepID=UPI00262773B7|nr:precorrin-2 C(20)-methyltransferase [Acaryochloris sp. IP29b_bin.137]
MVFTQAVALAEPPTIGTLYGIGVGPGDSELISLKGLRYLQQCPIVAYPAGLEGQPGIAEQIIAPWLTSQQQIPLTFPYVHNPHQLQQAWQVAASTIWHYLSQGQDIAFACEGDVGVYSTFTYLAETLANLYPHAMIQRIPGISSPMAAAAALDIPLAYQPEQVAIIPALQRLETLPEALAWADVVVLLKVSKVYTTVWQLLKKLNLLQTSYVVVRASMANQQIYQDLERYPDLQLPYFSQLIIVTSDRGQPGTQEAPETDPIEPSGT